MINRVKLGDIFRVRVGASDVRYFQYVADDLTQLNSQIVRVFLDRSDESEAFDADRVVSGVIDFHAHVFLKIGLRQELWKKVGHAQVTDKLDVIFRDTNDYGNPEIHTSQNWYVWMANGPFEDVGKLSQRYQKSEIGVVVPPDSLVHRMCTGHYDFFYPNY